MSSNWIFSALALTTSALSPFVYEKMYRIFAGFFWHCILFISPGALKHFLSISSSGSDSSRRRYILTHSVSDTSPQITFIAPEVVVIDPVDADVAVVPVAVVVVVVVVDVVVVI